MDVVDPRRSRSFVEVVDVLGDDQQVVTERVLQADEGVVGGVGRTRASAARLAS